VIGKTRRVSVVLLDTQVGLVIQQAVENMRGAAGIRGNHLGITGLYRRIRGKPFEMSPRKSEVLRMARSFMRWRGGRRLAWATANAVRCSFRDDSDSGYASESGMRRFHIYRHIDSLLYSCAFCQRGSDGLHCLLPLDCSSDGVKVHVVFVAVQMV
jgi:hypothetical protein